MPPRPFPYPLRVGADICSVSRIRAIISRPHKGSGKPALERFLNRILTSPERRYFWERFGPADNVSTKFDTVSQFLAGRFAAKEACRKACDHLDKNTRGLHRIVILPVTLSTRNGKKSSPPQGLILDQLLQDDNAIDNHDDSWDSVGRTTLKSWNMDHVEGQLCEISISHDGGFAVASAILPSMKEFHVSREANVHMGMQESALSMLANSCFADSAATESRITALLDKRSEDIRRRNAILDRFEQLQIEEQRVAAREQIILGGRTAEERQRLEEMLGVDGRP